MTPSTYITVDGEVRTYVSFPHRDTTRKPKCPSCGNRLTYVYRHHRPRNINIGYICDHCQHVYVDGKYRAFSLRKS